MVAAACSSVPAGRPSPSSTAAASQTPTERHDVARGQSRRDPLRTRRAAGGPLLASELTESAPVSTSRWRSSPADGPILLEPMAVWCTNCRAQMHEVTRAHETADFQSVSLDVDLSETAQDLAAYADREGWDWRFAVAGRGPLPPPAAALRRRRHLPAGHAADRGRAGRQRATARVRAWGPAQRGSADRGAPGGLSNERMGDRGGGRHRRDHHALRPAALPSLPGLHHRPAGGARERPRQRRAAAAIPGGGGGHGLAWRGGGDGGHRRPGGCAVAGAGIGPARDRAAGRPAADCAWPAVAASAATRSRGCHRSRRPALGRAGRWPARSCTACCSPLSPCHARGRS